jgi:hypothetical protein
MKIFFRSIAAGALAGLALLSTAAEVRAAEQPDPQVSEAQAPRFGDYQAKGFLSDYSGLKPTEGDEAAYLFETTELDKARYHKLMIDRIKIWFKDDAEYKGIDPAELKDLVDYFHQAIVEAVSDAYPVVQEPGPDVVRLRIAVTDVVPNKPEASVVSLVVPFVWLGEAGAGAAKDEPGSTPFVGEASIEMEALDSETSEQVAAYIETFVGKKYHWTKGVGTAISDYTKAYSTWAYTKQAFDKWAQLIRSRLDAAHGIASKAQ